MTASVRREILSYADPDHKDILLWLLKRYHWGSQWHFVARCEHRSYGPLSYQSHRVWSPTPEGQVLYQKRDLLDSLRAADAGEYLVTKFRKLQEANDGING